MLALKTLYNLINNRWMQSIPCWTNSLLCPPQYCPSLLHTTPYYHQNPFFSPGFRRQARRTSSSLYNVNKKRIQTICTILGSQPCPIGIAGSCYLSLTLKRSQLTSVRPLGPSPRTDRPLRPIIKIDRAFIRRRDFPTALSRLEFPGVQLHRPVPPSASRKGRPTESIQLPQEARRPSPAAKPRPRLL